MTTAPRGKGDDDDECGDEQNEYFLDDRMGLLYLRGENDRDLIAMAGPPGESIFQEVQEGALNQSGQVVFKTQTGVQEIFIKGNPGRRSQAHRSAASARTSMTAA